MFQEVSFWHVNKVPKNMDENCPISMLRWLITIITTSTELFVIIICGMIYYLRYGSAKGLIRHLFTLCSGRDFEPIN